MVSGVAEQSARHPSLSLLSGFGLILFVKADHAALLLRAIRRNNCFSHDPTLFPRGSFARALLMQGISGFALSVLNPQFLAPH